MSEVSEHYCSACGKMHGGEDLSAAVRIAEINARRDVQVARIEKGEAKAVVEAAGEAEIAVAELETQAEVAVAAELAEGAEPASEEPETAQVIVEGEPVEPEPEPESIEPSDSPEPPAEPRKSRGYWG